MLNLGTGLLSLLEKKHFSLIHTVTSQLRDGKDRVMLLYGIPSLNIAKCLKVHFSRTSDIADYSLKKTEPGPSTSKGFALVLQSFQKRSYVPHNPFRDPFMWDEPKKGCKPKHKGCRKIGKILGDKRHCCPCSEGRRFPQTLGRGFECKKCLVKKRTTPACNRHCRGHVLKCPKKRMTFCEYTDHKCKVPKKQNVPIFTYAALKEDRRRAAEEAEYGVEDPHDKIESLTIHKCGMYPSFILKRHYSSKSKKKYIPCVKQRRVWSTELCKVCPPGQPQEERPKRCKTPMKRKLPRCKGRLGHCNTCDLKVKKPSLIVGKDYSTYAPNYFSKLNIATRRLQRMNLEASKNSNPSNTEKIIVKRRSSSNDKNFAGTASAGTSKQFVYEDAMWKYLERKSDYVCESFETLNKVQKEFQKELEQNDPELLEDFNKIFGHNDPKKFKKEVLKPRFRAAPRGNFLIEKTLKTKKNYFLRPIFGW